MMAENIRLKQDTLPGARSLPRHLALFHAIESEINNGRHKGGSALPQERDLALQVGVSRVTVRRALQELEARRLVRRIRGKGTFVLHRHERTQAGLVAVTFFSIMSQSRHFAGANSVLRDHHRFPLAVSTSMDVDEQARILKHVLQQDVAGLIVCPAFSFEGEHRDNSELLAQIARSGKPVVTMDRILPEHKVSGVVFDHPACEDAAVQWLALRGVRQAGYLGLGQGFLGRAKFDAFDRAAHRCAMDWNPPRDSRLSHSVQPHWPERFGGQAGVELLRAVPQLEALVCYSRDVAVGAMRAIRQAGLGQRLRYLIFNWDKESQQLPDDTVAGLQVLATLRDAYAIGADAARLLMKQLVEGVPDQPVIRRHRPILTTYDEACRIHGAGAELDEYTSSQTPPDPRGSDHVISTEASEREMSFF